MRWTVKENIPELLPAHGKELEDFPDWLVQELDR